MNRFVRPAGMAAAWLGAGTAVTILAMLVATLSSPSGAGGDEGRLGGSLGAFGRAILRFSPLSPRLLALAGGGQDHLLGFDGPAGRPAPGEDPGDDGQPPPDDGLPGLEELTERPRLQASMSVDKAEAGPGETITYTIVVRNVGRGTAREVTVLSHIPEHTTLSPTPCDEPVTVRPGEGPRKGLPAIGICVPSPVPPPGQHGVSARFARLRPGTQETVVFSVIVNSDAPVGAVLRNHAHASGANAARHDSTEVTTRVR